MQVFKHQDQVIGLLISELESGTKAVTEGDQSLQLVTIKQPSGTVVKAHGHNPKVRTTQNLQECLVVLQGRIKVDLFADQPNSVQSVEVGPGQAFITVSGAHQIEFLEDSEVFEIKNGPFADDKVIL